MKIINTFKKIKINYILFLFIAIIFVVSFLNKFPAGYIFDNADSNQCIDCDKYTTNLLGYTWQSFSTGNSNISYPYYILVYFFNFLSKIFGLSNVIFFYYFVFLLGSFLSFRWSLKIFHNKINEWIADILSFMYAFWPFIITYYLSFYFGFLIIYAVIPLVFALSIKYLTDKKTVNKFLAFIGISFFILSIGYGNASFFIAFNILFLFFNLLLFIFLFYNKNALLFLKKFIVLYSVYFLSSFIFIIPQIPILTYIAQSLNDDSATWTLGGWILMSAMPLTHSFFMMPNISWFMSIFSPMSLIPGLLFFSIMALLFYIKNKFSNEKKIFIICAVMVLLTIFLSNKGKGYLNNNVIENIFTVSTFLSGIRSSDKTFFFLPFFLLFPIYFYLVRSKKATVIFSLLAISSYIFYFPFFKGDMYLKHYGIEEAKDFSTSYVTSIVKVPSEYLEEGNNISRIQEDFKIMSLPWNVMNSIGWVNYPKWKLVGIDGTTHLFNQSTISISSNLDGWLFVKQWSEEDPEQSKWIFPLSGILNVKYFIYHKDVDDKFIEQTAQKIKSYEESGMIRKIRDNNFFSIYEICNGYYLPHLYTPDNIVISKRQVSELPRTLSQEDSDSRTAIIFQQQNNIGYLAMTEEKLEKIENSDNNAIIEYKKINPTKYRLRIHSAKEIFPLVLSETYHPEWKAYVVKSSEEKSDMNSDSELEKYKILDFNEGHQASSSEVKDFIKNGWITTLGKGKNKIIDHFKWQGLDKKPDYEESYVIDFISKNIKNTIQNDNLPDGSIYETWLKRPIENNENHLMVNGYANTWLIDMERACGEEMNCTKNSDGSYDFEMIVEFWPQRIFYVGIFISGSTLLACLAYLSYNWRRNSIKTKNKDA